MKEENKWKLSTGTVVENRLYKFGIECKYEHLAHSLIIDPNDENYINQNVFTREELEEIKEFQMKPTPKISSDLLEYIESYNIVNMFYDKLYIGHSNFVLDNILDLRKRVNNSEAFNENFERSRHFDHDWIKNAAYNLLREYENESFAKNHLEAWYTIHLWSFIDKVFEDLNEVEIIRGESSSIASAERKNTHRTVPAVESLRRKSMGSRGDMLIRKGHKEYGCAEIGKFFEGENATKLLKERGLKAPKMLKDQYCNLCKYINYEEDKVRKIETIAFIHSGMIMMLLRLDSPIGYICRISRTKTYEIPTRINEFGKKVLPALVVALKSKMIVRNTIKLVENNDYSKAEYLEYLQDCGEIAMKKTYKRRINIPMCFQEPRKKLKTITNKMESRIPNEK
ncbi:12991_t:CDS:2 [Entrophospora sp. SA101]|nr:12991_t:CDS:2 [Entrophospora sp. SA101]